MHVGSSLLLIKREFDFLCLLGLLGLVLLVLCHGCFRLWFVFFAHYLSLLALSLGPNFSEVTLFSNGLGGLLLPLSCGGVLGVCVLIL